jgi:methionyl-tRNA formyltransferase
MRILFMGTPDFSVPTLEAVDQRHEIVAVATQPDRPRGRGRRVGSSPVKQWAARHAIPVEQPVTLRDPQVQAQLASYSAEVIVVVAYGLILPKEVLAMPPRGCINVHASLLPRHRGAAPVAWAILSGDRISGVTTMLMDEGLDTGPILLQKEESLDPRDTTPQVAGRFARLGAELLVETLDLWGADALQPTPQDDSAATLAPSFKKQDGKIDWRSAASVIDRQVRALQPWPGAYTFVEGRRLAIWAADMETPSPSSEVPGSASLSAGGVPPAPGTVVSSGPAGLAVSCAGGELLWIQEVQLAGRKRQPVGEFLRGRRVAVGARLGTED